jgi:hypothetical protein
MIARLILALLVATFAFPAVAPAACHDGQGAATHSANIAAMNDTGDVMHHVMSHRAATGTDEMSDRKSADDRATLPHGCIGCVPPSNWSSARIENVVPRDAALLVEHAAVFELGAAAAPGLRPPREA